MLDATFQTSSKGVEEGLSQSTHREAFDFSHVWATTPKQMHLKILKQSPQIVHFSGHGSGNGGLVLEDEETQASALVEARTLSKIFKLANSVECVVLNACYSEVQAKAIARHVPYTIGMNEAIADKAAQVFAIGFYEALGEGKDIPFAFNYGCDRISLYNAPGELTPVLIRQADVAGMPLPEAEGQAMAGASRKIGRQKEAPDNAVPQVKPEDILLDSLEGAVGLNSPFYVSSGAEEKAYQAMRAPGALVRIKSPQGMGKSSLTLRVLDHVRETGCRTVTIDFMQTNQKFLDDLDLFAQWFCASVGRNLGIRVKTEEYWDDIFGPNDNCTDYFERYLLNQDAPLTLALENFDRLFAYPTIDVDFCGLLRGWHEKSKGNETWGKLRLVIVYSQESYLPKDINQSPFNVGLPITLGPWSVEVVEEMARRYGIPFDAAERDLCMRMTGGHPELVRSAFYRAAVGDGALADLFDKAATEEGIYRSHLVERLSYLEQHPELKSVMRDLVVASEPQRVKSQDANKLDSMGLIRRVENDVTPLNQIYRDYFQEMLTA